MSDNEANGGNGQLDGSYRRRYRGGFSTSICDGLFEDPHDHAACCALTCCGILLYDRNMFLLSEKRPSWAYRSGIACCLCVLLVAFVAVSVTAVMLYNNEMEHLKKVEKEGGKPDQDDVTLIQVIKNLLNIAIVLRVIFWMMVGYFLCLAARYRFLARRSLMTRLYEEQLPDATRGSDETEGEAAGVEIGAATAETPLVTPTASNLDATLAALLEKEKYNSCCATAPLGFVAKDALVDPSDLAAYTADPTDLCHSLWKCLSAMCCGACCGCWCQCFGLCAMAQEGRELERMLPKEKFEMDYITFQPFFEYFPKLQELRQAKVNNMLDHIKGVSKLSKHLLQILGCTLGFLTILAITRIDPLFQPSHLLVVFMTLLQSFLIMYFVHWQWNRFDLSFDAVVKYFASGFILCTANALVYETFLSTFIAIVSSIIVGITTPLDADDDAASNDDGAAGAHPTAPIWVLAIMAFLNAFAVAAMVEEIAKYFGFWMVEHPDISLPVEETGSGTEGNGSADAASDDNTQAASQSRSMKSLGAGITVAMVAAALGFQCCENFVYVFVYTPPTTDAAAQLMTLIMRSIFPVHPLCAAIQSLGVVQRDVEKDSGMKFGRIIFPAVLLHGSFDFVLMFLSLLSGESASDDDDNNDGATTNSMLYKTLYAPLLGSLKTSSQDDDEASALGVLTPLISSVIIVLAGIIYYVVKALAQRKRLEELDRQRNGSGEYEQLL